MRTGTIAVVGVPNVGKSTLVNALVGAKVGIVSPKPQTTRRNLLGILTRDDFQIVFVDTPGIAQPRHRLGQALMKAARDSLSMADGALFVVDASRMPGEGDTHVASLVAGAPIVLCLNKMDHLPPDKVVAHSEAYAALAPGAEWMMTTATKGHNLDKLLALLLPLLHEGEALYPEEQYTDATERFQVAELIREQALLKTQDEVPHSVAVAVDRWEEKENGVLYIAATLYVERAGQKAILIGKGGQMLKSIGSAARAEIEPMLGRKVFMELWVKVKEDWRQRPGALSEFGVEG